MRKADRALKNRLGVLEAVLGIDSLAAEECSGDRLACEGACKHNACPMENHALIRLERTLHTISEHDRALRFLVRELEASRVLPVGTLERALSKAKVEQLESHLLEVTSTLHKLEEAGIVGTVLEEASRRKDALENDVSHARARIS